jgi:hypothetical protein
VKSILRRRPSPALVISLIALFVSLSGVSYGVATGFIDSREIKNNEVRSIDIRNNQIRTRDLRNNEVRGIDIRNSTVQGRDIALNTVTGEDVREDSLGKVPSALLADTATNANGVSTLKIIPQTTMAEGAPAVTLATQGPLTLSGTCTDVGGQTRAALTASTTQDNSAVSPADGDVDIADSPALINSVDNAGGTRLVELTQVFASAPDGKALTGQIAIYSDGSGAGTCMFHGHVALQG